MNNRHENELRLLDDKINKNSNPKFSSTYLRLKDAQAKLVKQGDYLRILKI
jgi:hypothetical protein